uniref:Uncharacterized protein n=1 Tax=Octopus bimaculoides TaxID=37653 RepID=A0A0L8GLJ3_OCTBM
MKHPKYISWDLHRLNNCFTHSTSSKVFWTYYSRPYQQALMAEPLLFDSHLFNS